jgi:hypothetical protein
MVAAVAALCGVRPVAWTMGLQLATLLMRAEGKGWRGRPVMYLSKVVYTVLQYT